MSRDSDVSYEYSVVRAYLSDYYDRYGRYPDLIEDTVEYNGEDFHLKNYGTIVYIPGDNRNSFDLRWSTSGGLTIYEKWEKGINTKRGQSYNL